jgi:hypothetical protein
MEHLPKKLPQKLVKKSGASVSSAKTAKITKTSPYKVTEMNFLHPRRHYI